MDSTATLTFGSLFAGIGGFDLGFERAGMRCEWQVEIDAYCRQLLSLRFPNARQWDDVRTFAIDNPEQWRVDVLCGGFPCQDISNCGDMAGIDGEKSGLWREYVRIISALRPRYVVVENVAALLVRGIGRVLGDLAALRYDAEWDCLPASAFGAYHERDRIFLVAYPTSVNGRPHDLLEAGRDWGPSLQSGRLSRMALAEAGQRENTRLRFEPGLDRLVLRLPGAVYRLEGVGDSIFPAAAEFVGRLIVQHARIAA